MDSKNVIFAIVLSTIVLIFWATFFEPPIIEEKVTKIFIHGFLHLLGFDHKKNKDYYKMLKEENLLFKSVQPKIN